MSFAMNDILPTIRSLAQMELGDIGDNEGEQNDMIFRLTNVVLRKRARQAYVVEMSPPLEILTSGYQSFVTTNMYEPLDIYNASGRKAKKRSSWDAPIGWWRSSEYQGIHTKGMTGSHTLHYLRYPSAVTSDTSLVEFPMAGQMDLIMDVVQMIKLVKNYYSESDAIKARATGTAAIKASIAAKGTYNSPPSLEDKVD